MQVKAKGIDTSAWQGSKVDYAAAKKEGISFVILRIGCGSTKDKCFEADYAAAKAAGLKVGVYLYTYSTTSQEALYDATRVLGWLNNRKLDLPVAYDVEDKKQQGTDRRSINTAMYNVFKEKIEQNNVYDAMLYTGEYFYNNYFDKNKLTDDLWIAKYASKEPSVGRDIAIWQYSSSEIHTTYYKGALDRNNLYIDTFQGSRAAVINESLNPYPVPTRNLKRTLIMMQGNDVKWLQWELNQAGYKIAIDGKFGNATKNALMEYQKKHGLKVDGIAGPATRYSMIND